MSMAENGPDGPNNSPIMIGGPAKLAVVFPMIRTLYLLTVIFSLKSK